jgi:hypothetical protein
MIDFSTMRRAEPFVILAVCRGAGGRQWRNPAVSIRKRGLAAAGDRQSEGFIPALLRSPMRLHWCGPAIYVGLNAQRSESHSGLSGRSLRLNGALSGEPGWVPE